MNEEKEVNIMSVELALKRELAYQKKLARLHSEDDQTNELLTLEVLPSTIMSNSFPSSIHLGNCTHSFSILNNWSPSPNSCLSPLPTLRTPNQDIIPYPWPNMEITKASIRSITKEKSTANSFQGVPNNLQVPIYMSNSTNLFCEVCQVSCSGVVSFQQHVRGQKHKEMLQSQQPTRKAGGANTSNHLSCNQSNVWCSGEDGLKLHFNSQKRKGKFQEVELGQKRKASNQLWCQLCRVSCSHEDTYLLHLKGKSHVAKLQALKKDSRGV